MKVNFSGLMEDLWDKHSTYIEDDIDSLSMVAGSIVMKKSDFVKLSQSLEKLLESDSEPEGKPSDIIGTFEFDHDKQEEKYTPNSNFTGEPEGKEAVELREALEKISHDAYPEDIFPPITSEQWKEIHEMIKEKFGFPIDRLTAEYGRLLRKPIISIATEALNKAEAK